MASLSSTLIDFRHTEDPVGVIMELWQALLRMCISDIDQVLKEIDFSPYCVV